jgi:hypothetical protein
MVSMSNNVNFSPVKKQNTVYTKGFMNNLNAYERKSPDHLGNKKTLSAYKTENIREEASPEE